jgi:hypothetical protein
MRCEPGPPLFSLSLLCRTIMMMNLKYIIIIKKSKENKKIYIKKYMHSQGNSIQCIYSHMCSVWCISERKKKNKFSLSLFLFLLSIINNIIIFSVVVVVEIVVAKKITKLSEKKNETKKKRRAEYVKTHLL